MIPDSGGREWWRWQGSGSRAPEDRRSPGRSATAGLGMDASGRETNLEVRFTVSKGDAWVTWGMGRDGGDCGAMCRMTKDQEPMTKGDRSRLPFLTIVGVGKVEVLAGVVGSSHECDGYFAGALCVGGWRRIKVDPGGSRLVFDGGLSFRRTLATWGESSLIKVDRGWIFGRQGAASEDTRAPRGAIQVNRGGSRLDCLRRGRFASWDTRAPRGRSR